MTAAAVGTAIATTLATKALEKTGEKLGEKAFDEAGKFIVLLRSKSPSTATAIEKAEQQPLVRKSRTISRGEHVREST